MPTYEYACEACENAWEAEQRITEPALTDCPKCGAAKARRLISGSRFVLKGGGWYADGYGSKPAAKSDSKPSETKTESKSETKTESSSDAKSSSSDSKSTSAS